MNVKLTQRRKRRVRSTKWDTQKAEALRALQESLDRHQ